MRFARFVAVAALVSTCAFGAGEPSHQQFEQTFKTGVAPLAGKEIVGLKVVYVDADVGPWSDTGFEVKAGDRITLALSGKVYLSRTYDLSFDAPMAVWFKIGDRGTIFRAPQATDTFVAKDSGTVRIKPYPSRRWADASGKYLGDPAPVNPDAGGGASVALVRWSPSADVDEQLRRIAATGDAGGWAGSELARRASAPQPTPAGWHYLWELGTTPVFSEATPKPGSGAPARAVALHTKNDVAILQKDVAFDLTPDTVLEWKWRADKLPAAAAENALPTHDYMSIAVEFDNGRDLTYMWSRELPAGTSFPCPLPGWDDRETHVVARTGVADLGKWLSESRNVSDQYAKSIDGRLPRRITRVWLIGVSLFQKGEGESQFGDIVIRNGSRTSVVY